MQPMTPAEFKRTWEYRLLVFLTTIIVLALIALGALAAREARGQTVAAMPTVTKTVGQTANVYWSAPTTYTDGTAIAAGAAFTYSVYEAASSTPGSCAGASYGAPVQTGITALSYTPPAYSKPGNYCYVETATLAGATSAPGNPVQAIVTGPTSNPPGAVGIK